MRFWPGNPRRSATSCSAPPSSTGSPARSATRSPAAPTARRTFEDLERANLFVVPLDAERAWYRYHHLFADVLRARLLAEHPADLPDLHLRSSDWFATNGMVADAVRHALAAKNFDRAGYLIEEAMPQIRPTRQDGLLLTWVRSLPEPVVRRSPVLCILSSWSLLMSGDLDAAGSRLDDAEAALAAGALDPDLAATWADTEDLRTAPATVHIYRAALAQARGDVAGTVRHAQHALDLAGPEDHFVRGGADGISAWPPGPPEALKRRCPRSPMRVAVCGPPATSSTRWRPRSRWRTCGSRRASRAARAGSTSKHCRPSPQTVPRIPGPWPICTSVWPSSTAS